LLNAWADVNAQCQYGRTALMHIEDIDIVRLLLKAGADVNARNMDDRTALTEDWVRDEKKELLIAAGAEADLQKIPELKPLVRKVCHDQIFQICVGLQSLDLSAFELLAIVDESNPNMAHLTMHQKWTAITSVKHFHDEN